MRVMFLVSLIVGLVFNLVLAQDFRSSKADFLKMANYLSAGSGKWRTPNPSHDPTNSSSHQALGLWFELKLNQNLLKLSIVAYRGDTAHIASQSMWIWHPGEQRMRYYDTNLRGYFMEGETYFISDDVFVTRSFNYMPDGSIHFARGENKIISEDQHFTRSNVYETENGGSKPVLPGEEPR